MIEHVLGAMHAGGFADQEIVFVCGYLAETIQRAYPSLSYVANNDWPNNNILLSLLCARHHLGGGFLSSYADIVYRPEAIQKAMASPHDITLVCDTAWRRRYVGRSQHPESDAEKLRLEGDRVVEISRHIPSERASGEFIGVMRLSARGAEKFLAAFDEVQASYAEKPEFREGRSFQKAYLIDLLQYMLEQGVDLHAVTMRGGYMEIDTTQDARLAEQWWRDPALQPEP